MKNESLYSQILSNTIPADRLVRMSPEELASKELAQWRETQSKTVGFIKISSKGENSFISEPKWRAYNHGELSHLSPVYLCEQNQIDLCVERWS